MLFFVKFATVALWRVLWGEAMKQKLVTGALASAISFFAVVSSSYANSLGTPTWSGVCIAVDSTPCSGPAQPPLPSSNTVTASDATAQLIGTLSPVASITGSVSTTGNGAAISEANLLYDIQVTYSGSGSPATVKLGYIANGSISSTQDAQAFLYLSVESSNTYVHSANGSIQPDSFGLQSGFNASSFQITNTLDVSVGAIIAVYMNMQVDANAGITQGNTAAAAQASIDPYFFIDLPDPSGYSILVTDGVGNATSATPVPPTLPLFASGLGGLGLLGWRRKRKAAALAA
jgi:hypothetical protein